MKTKTLQLVKHKDIDQKKWDQTVNASAFPSLFANSFYLNAVSPGWDALIGPDYSCVFPVCLKKKLSIEYLPQPLFTGQLGLFGNFSKDTEMEVYTYLQNRFKLVEFELNCMHQSEPPEMKTMTTYVIRYGEEIIYNQNTKRNIAKARSLKFQVIELEPKLARSLSESSLNPFLKQNLGVHAEGIASFERLLDSTQKSGHLKSFAVYDPTGKLRALAHFIFTQKHAVYLKGTNFDKAENTGSMHLLMDYAIQEFRQEKRIFDFGGGTIAGIGNFFRGLGGSPLSYSKIHMNHLPKWTRWFKKNQGEVAA